MKTAAIIPAYNEAESLPAVLADLARHLPDVDVVVVDDGSIDETAAVAAEHGAICLSLPFNLGIGGALRMGFRFVVEEGYDRAFQFDGDGQHDAQQVHELLGALDDGADLVVGSRFHAEGDYKVGVGRRLAMGLLRFGTRRLSGRRFSDTSSGFRGFSHRLLVHFAQNYPVEYMDSVEALVTTVRSGYDVREVPVTMRERAGGQPSNRNIRLVYHYLRVLIVLLTSPRRTAPLPPT